MRRRFMMAHSGDEDLAVLFVQYVDEFRVNFGTSWASASSQLPSSVQVTMSDYTLRTASVSWAQGTYSSSTSSSYPIVGTLSGVPNPNGVTADATIEVYHQGFNDLTSQGFNSVFYDFTNLYTPASGVLVNGEVGLNDLGPNARHAVITGAPVRGRIQQNFPYVYSLYAQSAAALLIPSPCNDIVGANRVDFFVTLLTLDGVPVGSSNYWGARSTGPQGYNFYNNAGKLTCDIGDGTNTVSIQSTSAIFVNGQNPCKILYFSIDYVANTAVCRQGGVNVPLSILAGSIASIVPANINNTNNFCIGSTNNLGTIGNHTELVSIPRFAMVANFTDAAAARVEDYFLNNSYPFPSIYEIMQYGDSQSEGAAESGRITAQGVFTLTPAEVIIYFKTARNAVDNGTWPSFSGGVNNELLGTGSVISDDVALTQLLHDRLGSGRNVTIIKGNQGGQLLNVTLLPPSGTQWVNSMADYWLVGHNKLVNANPTKRIKGIFDGDFGTNDASTGGAAVTNWPANLDTLITAVRSYNAHFATCPIFLTELNTTLNATQLSMNAILKAKCESYSNVFYVSGDTADHWNDVMIRKRKQDLTVPEQLGVAPTTSGGDDGHRSYLGANAKGALIMTILTDIGYIPD